MTRYMFQWHLTVTGCKDKSRLKDKERLLCRDFRYTSHNQNQLHRETLSVAKAFWTTINVNNEYMIPESMIGVI